MAANALLFSPKNGGSRASWADAILGISTFGVALHGIAFRSLPDWHVFFVAGQRALAGEPLYRAHEIPMVFKYAPVAAYVFAPFAALSESAGGALWLIISAGALFRSFQLSRRLFVPTTPSWINLPVFVLALGFYKHLALYGQCDALLLWLVLESEGCAVSRPLRSGALLALACVFKPPMGILAVGAIAAHQWRRVLSIGVVGGLSLAVPALTFGVSGTIEQTRAWRSMLEQTTGPMVCGSGNQGVFAFACRFASPEAVVPFTLLVTAFAVAIVAGLGFGLWRIFRIQASRARRVALGCAIYLSAVLSPLSWRANLLALVPLLFLLVDGARNLPKGGYAALAMAPAAASMLFVLGAYEIIGPERFEWLMATRIIGLLGLTTAAIAVRLQLDAARLSSPMPVDLGEGRSHNPRP